MKKLADQALFEKDGSKNVSLSIKNLIANELPVIKSSVEKLLKSNTIIILKQLQLLPYLKEKQLLRYHIKTLTQ